MGGRRAGGFLPAARSDRWGLPVVGHHRLFVCSSSGLAPAVFHRLSSRSATSLGAAPSPEALPGDAPRRPLPSALAGSSCRRAVHRFRSEEHTSELQSLMRISYAVFCLKKKKQKN